MKKVFVFLLILVFAKLADAQPPAGPANPGDTYGEKIIASGTMATEKLAKQLTDKDTVATKLTGKVLASCPKKGCWMNVELADKTKMFVRFKDYGFFVPTDIVGKTVVLEGIAFNKTVSVDELKHYAEDAKKPQAEIDAITQPEKQVRFLADGVLVVK